MRSTIPPPSLDRAIAEHLNRAGQQGFDPLDAGVLSAVYTSLDPGAQMWLGETQFLCEVLQNMPSESDTKDLDRIQSPEVRTALHALDEAKKMEELAVQWQAEAGRLARTIFMLRERLYSAGLDDTGIAD
jgi:hypothetical protein